MNKRLKTHLIANACLMAVPGLGSVLVELVNKSNPDIFDFEKETQKRK